LWRIDARTGSSVPMLDGSGVDKHSGDSIYRPPPPQPNGAVVGLRTAATDGPLRTGRPDRVRPGHEPTVPGRRHVRPECGLVASADPSCGSS
jgi:hypothetical protein